MLESSARFLAAPILCFVASTGSAALVIDHPADFGTALTSTPLFRGIAFSGFDADGSPGSFAIENGVDYFNNSGPRPGTQVSATASKNGATMTSSAQSISGNYFQARISASMTVTNAQASDGYYTVAGYGNRSRVTFYAPPDAASVRYSWTVSGTESIPIGSGGSRFDFLTGVAGTYTSWNDLFLSGNAFSTFEPGTFTFTIPVVLGTPTDIFWWAAAYTQIDPGQATTGASYSLYADYGSTFDLSVSVVDAYGNPLSGWEMVDSLSGATVFGDGQRIATTYASYDVPAPETLALLGIGGLCIAAMCRRKCRASARGR